MQKYLSVVIWTVLGMNELYERAPYNQKVVLSCEKE